jgi:hypothetical protein
VGWALKAVHLLQESSSLAGNTKPECFWVIRTFALIANKRRRSSSMTQTSVPRCRSGVKASAVWVFQGSRISLASNDFHLPASELDSSSFVGFAKVFF